MAGVIVIAVLTLAHGRPALAQSQGLGGILNDALGGLLSQGDEHQRWHGHFVQAKDATMILRAEDGKTYAVDMSTINAPGWQTLTLGQPVTLVAKPGSGPQTLIATRIEAEQQDRSGRVRAPRAFRATHGVVERVDGSQLTMRTAENGLISVDLARMTGEAEFHARDGALLILEPGPSNTVVWIEREGRRGGGGRDILSGLPGDYRRLHGYRVYGSGSTMIVLADDGATSSVDMTAIRGEDPIELGEGVTLAVKPGREPNSFVAARTQADAADPSTGKVARRPFESVRGSVEAIRGSTIRFRTSDGVVLRVDASRMPGVTALQANDRGALTYERGPDRQVTGLWLEQRGTRPGNPAGARPAEYQRIHGYVQSVGWDTMSLKADDGRTLTVDTSQIDSQMRTGVRPGDLVNVLGKTHTSGQQFVAERIESEARR